MKKGVRQDDRASWATLLRRLAECVESAKLADLEELLAGSARLQIRLDKRSESQSPSSPPPDDRPPADWSSIADRLRSLPSRDEGEKLLSEVTSTKAQLERLARAMDLPVAKYENTEQLRQKIIESSIGSRLVSRAIRGDIDSVEDK